MINTSSASGTSYHRLARCDPRHRWWRPLLVGLVVLAAALTEGAANDWVSLAVVDGFEQSHAVGALTFALFREAVSRSVTVSDEEIVRAVRLLKDAGERVEPSGAVPSAAVLAGRVPSGGPIVALVTGGNVDADVYERLTVALSS